MSNAMKKLRGLVNKRVEGIPHGTEKFAVAAEVSVTTVYNIRKRNKIPEFETLLKVTRQCVPSEEDARVLALACVSEKLQRSA